MPFNIMAKGAAFPIVVNINNHKPLTLCSTYYLSDLWVDGADHGADHGADPMLNAVAGEVAKSNPSALDA